MDSHPADLGMTPAVTHISHWWYQEQQPANCSHYQKNPTLHVNMYELWNGSLLDIKIKRHLVYRLHALLSSGKPLFSFWFTYCTVLINVNSLA